MILDLMGHQALKIITSRLLKSFPELVSGSSTLFYGFPRPSKDIDSEQFIARRNLLAHDLNLEAENWFTGQQVHGDNIKVVLPRRPGERVRDSLTEIKKCDSLITAQANVILVVSTADCVPVFLYDPLKKICALVHAGWQGTLSAITAKTVIFLKKIFGTRPSELAAYIGPSIGVCCYDNAENPEKLRLFKNQFGREVLDGKAIDLKKANVIQLRKAGVNLLEVSPYCTACRSDLFPSHRREGRRRKGTILHILSRKNIF